MSIILQLPLGAFADDLRTRCAGIASLADAIRCADQSSPPNPHSPRQPSLIPYACDALKRWRESIANGPAVTAQETDLSTKLSMACTQQENLRLANYFLEQHRYNDATTYLNKIGDQALLPEVAKQVQRGLRTAAVLQNTVVLPPKEVLDLESRKQFDQAYTVLARSVPESDSHRKNLAMLLQLHRDSTPQEQRHEYQTVLAAYQQYLGTLSPDRVRDQYLFEEADESIARLEPFARQQADRDAQAQLDAAALQIQRGQFSDAITTLSQVTGKAGNVAPVLIDEAARKLADARAKSAGEPAIRGTLLVFLWSIPKALLSLLSWLSYAVVVAGASLAIWLIAMILVGIRKPASSILLSMRDSTSLAGTQNGHVLSEQLRREMDLPRPDRELRVDTAGEMDGSGLGQLSLRVPFRAAETVFQSNTAVPFGPFSINPVAIFTAIGSWFQPHHRLEIEGELLLLGSDTVCSARLVYGHLTQGSMGRGRHREQRAGSGHS
jgi:hypothetical protein